MKHLNSILAALALFTFSCGAGDGSSPSEKENLIFFYHGEHTADTYDLELGPIEFVADITVEDSLNLHYKQYGQGMNDTYLQIQNKIVSANNLKTKSEGYLNNGGDGSIEYRQNEVDKYTKEMEARIKELNDFVDASNGIKNDSYWNYFFTPIANLITKAPETIVGKVYKTDMTYMEGNKSNGANQVSRTGYFLFSPDEKVVLGWLDSYSKPESVAGIGPFYKYGEAGGTANPVDLNAAVVTVDVKYVSGEFNGACTVKFRTGDGVELKFINPSLGKYENENGCGINWSITEELFEITYEKGTVSYYIEDVGDVEEEGLILKSITQI